MCKTADRFTFRHLLLLMGCAMLSIIAVCSTVWAGGIAQTLPLKTVFEQKTPITIPVTNVPGKATLEFAAPMVQKDGVLCIKFRAFLKMDEPGPWANNLKLTLNGKQLGAIMPDNSDRLLNRGNMCVTAADGKMPWWNNDALMVFFGTESALDKRVTAPWEEGYWYVMNISDAANFTWTGLDDRIEGGVPNNLVIENLYTVQSSCREMIVKDLSIGYISQNQLNKLHGDGAMALPNLTGRKLTTQGSTLTVAASGAMQLKVGKDKYLISSAFSYPDKSIGYNRFSWSGQSAPEWKTSLASGKSTGSISVKGVAKGYTITRKITVKNGHFSISDTIENKTDDPLGMIVRNSAFVPQPFAPGDSYLCGVVDGRRMDACAGNPTMFVRQPGSSLGIVVEDTLFRMQFVEDRIYNYVQFGTEHFGLKPHAKYTLEWTLYPSKEKDYFTFVNRVRNDWGLNFTIPGPASFTRAALPQRETKIYIMQPWLDYYNGTGISNESFKALQKDQIAKVLAIDPDAITMGLIETNLVPLKRVDVKGGDSISTDQTYGLKLTADQSATFMESPWYESMIRGTDGLPYVDTVYGRPPYLNMMVYPAPGNYHLKYILSQIDFLMDDVGFKGVYFDQFELANTAGGMGRADYSKWDGHTVDLDSKGVIASKYTDAAYMGTPARVEIIKHVQEKGGIVVTNGHSYAKETAALHALNFSETEWDVNTGEEILNWNEPPALPSIAEAHLDSPVGLGIRPAKFGQFGTDHLAEIIHKWVIDRKLIGRHVDCSAHYLHTHALEGNRDLGIAVWLNALRALTEDACRLHCGLDVHILPGCSRYVHVHGRLRHHLVPEKLVRNILVGQCYRRSIIRGCLSGILCMRGCY